MCHHILKAVGGKAIHKTEIQLFMGCRERRSRVRIVYITQDTSRMGTAK